MEVLITGAAGYIGSNLLVGLANYPECKRIIAVDNFCTTRRPLFEKTKALLNQFPQLRFYEVDYYDLEEMIPLLEQVDIVVHLAEEKDSVVCEERHTTKAKKIVDWQKYKSLYCEKPTMTKKKVINWQKHVEGYRRLLEACIVCGIKRIILGSWAGVYVSSGDRIISEDETLLPINQNYHQKISQEYYNKIFALEYYLDTVTLRLSNVYGVGSEGSRWCSDSDPGVISIMVEKAIRDKEIIVHNKGLQKRNFVYIGDVVDALIKVISFKKSFSGKTFNICSDEETRIIDVATWISELFKTHIDFQNVRWQKNIVQYPISNLRAKKSFGFHPTSNMRVKIAEMVDAVRRMEGYV